MKKALLVLTVILILVPSFAFAQKGGSFVGSLGLGLTSAQGDFSDGAFLAAGSGMGIEAELRYYLLGGFGLGGFVNYTRFGSGHNLQSGRLSYNFSQIGGLVKMNFFSFKDGKLYLAGGGGLFTPSAHFYVPDNSRDFTGASSGNFFFGGIGLVSKTDRQMMYELEIRYNLGTADFYLPELDDLNINYDKWNYIYAGFKVSFSSKGKPAPPRY